MRTIAVLAILQLLFGAARSGAVELKDGTVRSWDEYIQILNSNMEKRTAGEAAFLAVDEAENIRNRVRSGDVIVSSHDPRRVPQGLIHDWVGDIFIPDVTLDQAMAVLGDYERFTDFYKPLIRKSVVIGRDGDSARLSIVAMQRAFSVTAAVDTEDEIKILKPAPQRACITSNAVRVQEIANYGQPSQHPFPEDRGPGYVWRAVVSDRLEERDGGVYVELETVTLSRGIPIEFRWLVKPLTDELPRRMMVDMLNDTRSAVQEEVKNTVPSRGGFNSAAR